MIDFVQRILLFTILAIWPVPPPAAQGGQATMFYAVAHEDDWQLFMSPNPWNDVRIQENKVVFIYTTAGDAGLGLGTDGRPTPYVVAREEGAQRAVRFLADAGRIGESATWEEVVINGKTLPRYVYKNTVSYFLRLPDGNFNGEGYPSTGNQSLRRLHQGVISTLTSVDAELTFFGWEDLVETLMKLIVYEARECSVVWLNVPDPRSDINWLDHSDHRYTGLCMVEASQTLSCVHKALFVNYPTAWMPRNLDTDALIVESAVWGVTTSGLSDFFHRNTFDSLHGSWLGRNYFRIEWGTGSCSFR